jgi:hypothetical protein
MFERYTEKARRAIFFARYEASQFGLEEINSDCLLLGVLREGGQMGDRWLGISPNQIRESVARNTVSAARKVSTSVDLPLTNEAKRVLAYAAEEADRMAHRHIGTEHLFLGLLHEPESFAGRLARECGTTLEKVRADLAEDAAGVPVRSTPGAPRGQQVILQLEGGGEMATVLWSGRIPAIGESISLPHSSIERLSGPPVPAGSSDGIGYRIVDVRWRVRDASLAAAVSTEHPAFEVGSVVLTVRKELA